MKVILIIFLFSFFSSGISYASQNIIVLIDRELLNFSTEEADIGAEVIADNKEGLKRAIINDLLQRLNVILRGYPTDNNYCFYLMDRADFGFFSEKMNIQTPKSLSAIGTMVENTKEDKWQKKLNTNIYELIRNNNSFITISYGKKFYDLTLLVIFNKDLLSNIFSEDASTLLTFKELSNFSYRRTFNYEYLIKKKEIAPDGSIKDSTIYKLNPVQLRQSCYILTKKTPSIFNAISEATPIIFHFDRKTIPYTDKLQLFPVSDSELAVAPVGKTRVSVVWCKLLYIEGGDSHLKLENMEMPKVFSQNLNTLPPQLYNPLHTNSTFPFYQLIKSTIILDSTTPVDTAYYGKMAIRYKLLDAVYSHAIFNDTLHFKLEVVAPIYMQTGLLKRLFIDNGVLIRYGNKLNLQKEWTQTELAKKYSATIKIAVSVIFLLSALLIFLIKRFIIDKKRLTIKKLVPLPKT